MYRILETIACIFCKGLLQQKKSSSKLELPWNSEVLFGYGNKNANGICGAQMQGLGTPNEAFFH